VDDELLNLEDEFVEAVPDSAEVVVEYRISSAICGDGHRTVDSYAYGTALIPRDTSKRIRDNNNLNQEN
jgi:hypothetical protein